MAKSPAQPAPYRADLAAIHDAGFGDVARAAADELLAQLQSRGIASGTIVDLGCGSGILAEVVSRAGYQVIGFDISPAMIALARRRAPRAAFHTRSFLAAELPACVAVTAIGEVFNYLFDPERTDARLWRFLHRVHAALEPGGLLLFDMAAPGRVGPSGQVRSFTAADDWACLYAACESPGRGILEREITTFRRSGSTYTRDYEMHRLRLISRDTALAQLRGVGFQARTIRSYASFRFPRGWIGYLARKPAQRRKS